MLLEVKNLFTQFHNENSIIRAVDDLSFKIFQNEITGIVGDSGCGKSVTAISVMRLLKTDFAVSSGEIIYYKNNTSVDLCKLTTHEITKIRGNEIAMIFQEPFTSLNPVLKCGDQIAEVIMLHQKVKKNEAYLKVIDLFKNVEFEFPESIYNAFPFQLSGGQLQRVMIAMAICCEPRLLIADEPTSNLDNVAQHTILKLLKRLQQQTGMSIILISHNLNTIAEIADRVVVMQKGKVVEQGLLKDVVYNSQNNYTRNLFAYLPLNNLKIKAHTPINNLNKKASKSESNKRNSVSEKTDIDSRININDTSSESQITNTAADSEQLMLKIQNLRTYFEIRNGVFGKKTTNHKAVDDVSFELYRGETLGIIGESGSGKTTLSRTILRLIEPVAGRIVFNGQNITEMDRFDLREIRKQIQIVFQDPYSALNPVFTVGEAIMEPMKVHHLYKSKSQQKDRTIELLYKVNLSEDFYYRYPNELSGGQRQRIALARALALKPKLLVCDESVSSLDVAVQTQVLNLLNDLKHEFNLTYIFISHDLNIVNYMSDRIIVMHKGKIEEQGRADDVYNNPKSVYTKRLIEAVHKGYVN